RVLPSLLSLFSAENALAPSRMLVAVHLWTGRSEIERICSRGWHDDEMTRRFSRSLLHSKELKDVAAALFYPTTHAAPPATQDLVQKIAAVKKFDPENRMCGLPVCIVPWRYRVLSAS